MILIADSGSTKTDWVLIDQTNKSHFFKSTGLNPFFYTPTKVAKVVEKTFKKKVAPDLVEKIFFYGAGVFKNLTAAIISDGLKIYFKNAIIHVEDDMIGAARAVFGDKSGIACILGTGANSSKYDGTKLIEKIPPLGYILGDEASGAYFGKVLLNNYFKKIMPEDISEKFRQKHDTDIALVLSKVYKDSYPNRYLAKFTHFLSENISHPYCINVLRTGFDAFFDANITRYINYKDFELGFVGSIAYHFSEILKESGNAYNTVVGNIIEKPIDGLIKYHINK
jgi:glucosamine kinase